MASSQRSRTPILFVSQLFCLLVVCQLIHVVQANPHSKAYIPYRTDPYDQPSSKNNIADFRSDSSDNHKNNDNSRRKVHPRLYEPEKAIEQAECPLRFSLGVSRRSGNDAPGLGSLNSLSSPLGIQQPPVIYPILPWLGPGRQVLYATQYEHLDMLTPSKGDDPMSSSLMNDNGDTDAFPTSKFIREGLTEHLEFPLLFESSAFQTNPVIADVNGDGILDAILTDYHGGLYAIGLQIGDGNENHGTNHRYFMKSQVPRMYVRRQWVEAMVNETLGIDPYEAEKNAEEEERKAEEERKTARAAAVANGEEEPKDETDSDRGHQFHANEDRPHDPYHSYFEYVHGSGNSKHEPILQGVTANVLEQDQEHVEGLEERRNRNHHPPKKEETVVYDTLEEEQKRQDIIYDSIEEDEKNQHIIYDSVEEDEKNQKIIYDSIEEDEKNQKIIYDSAERGIESDHRRLQQVEGETNDDVGIGDDMTEWGEFTDDLQRLDDDIIYADSKHENQEDEMGGDEGHDEQHQEAEGVHVDGDADTFVGRDDDMYPRYDDVEKSYHDDYARYDHHDDFYSGRYNDAHEDYFDDKHYIRLPPHILCTPVIVELPKLYSNNIGESETLLFLAVSYYFDEDEYEGFFSYKRFENGDHGDETETQRGMYTANAIVVFHFGDSPRWGECYESQFSEIPTGAVYPVMLCLDAS